MLIGDIPNFLFRTRSPSKRLRLLNYAGMNQIPSCHKSKAN